jgi:polyferredoxin
MINFKDITLPSNRKFGVFFTAVFTIGAYFTFNEAVTISYLLFFLAVIFCGITLISADTLLPLNKLWMGLGLFLGMIVSPLVLGIIFFGLFTPISLLTRLLGRDELSLRMESKASHWKERNADITEKVAFKQQF